MVSPGPRDQDHLTVPHAKLFFVATALRRTISMMRPDEIRAHLRKHPFRPIRIYISDGFSYDVRHPEMMFVTRSEVVIGLDPGDGDIPERSAYCDPIHITRIEPLDSIKKKRSSRRRK